MVQFKPSDSFIVAAFAPAKIRTAVFMPPQGSNGWLGEATQQRNGTYLIEQCEVRRGPTETFNLRDPFGWKKAMGVDYFPINVERENFQYWGTGQSEVVSNFTVAMQRLSERAAAYEKQGYIAVKGGHKFGFWSAFVPVK